MGVITATFGGIVRDLLGSESPVILSREIYASAALLVRWSSLMGRWRTARIGRWSSALRSVCSLEPQLSDMAGRFHDMNAPRPGDPPPQCCRRYGIGS